MVIDNYQQSNPPFSHLGFYYSEIAGAEAFYKIYSFLLARGALAIGKFCIEQRRETETPSFTHKVGWFAPIAKVVQTDNPEVLFTDSDIRVHFCYLLNAVGTRDNTEEMLMHVNISETAAQRDHYPIELVVDGSMYFPVKYMTAEQLNFARLAGLREYQTFIDIVEATKPNYATLTTEQSIQSPTDLEQAAFPLQFHNFYISSQYFPTELVRENILNLYKDAYIQELSEGFYISTWHFLNPQKTDWPHEQEKRHQASLEIVKLIIQKHRNL
jgi:hypothetical protein